MLSTRQNAQSEVVSSCTPVPPHQNLPPLSFFLRSVCHCQLAMFIVCARSTPSAGHTYPSLLAVAVRPTSHQSPCQPSSSSSLFRQRRGSWNGKRTESTRRTCSCPRRCGTGTCSSAARPLGTGRRTRSSISCSPSCARASACGQRNLRDGVSVWAEGALESGSGAAHVSNFCFVLLSQGPASAPVCGVDDDDSEDDMAAGAGKEGFAILMVLVWSGKYEVIPTAESRMAGVPSCSHSCRAKSHCALVLRLTSIPSWQCDHSVMLQSSPGHIFHELQVSGDSAPKLSDVDSSPFGL